jgi:L-threonylcarbamoyladenylate synthase
MALFPLEDAAAAVRLLAAGGVVLLPSDTLPGLHCRSDLAPSVARVVALKGQVVTKPLLLLCAEVEGALALASVLDDRARAYSAKCWPGPFTLILKAGPRVPTGITAGKGSVAVRVPASAPLRALLAAVGQPLVSTSANRTGEPPSRDMEAAERLFGAQVDGVLRAWPSGAEHEPAGRASALIALTSWPPRLLREGPLPAPGWQ